MITIPIFVFVVLVTLAGLTVCFLAYLLVMFIAYKLFKNFQKNNPVVFLEDPDENPEYIPTQKK